MSTVRLTERCAFADIVQWRLPAMRTMEVSRGAGFEPGVQGVAVSALRSIATASHEFDLLCEFPEPSSIEACEQSFFGSPFGFAVARLTGRIYFEGRSKPASPSFKSLLGATYRSRGGLLGIGTHRSLVCVDPHFPIPPALLRLGSIADDAELPPPSSFGTLLRRMAKDIGFSTLFGSHAESDVVTFVYEAFRNCAEHGIPSDERCRSRSTRAVLLEKLVLKSSDISTRRISDELKGYAERIVESQPVGGGLGIVCVTVVDQGDSIQGTLPAKSALETDVERLVRAFGEGESRKAQGIVNRGLGLPKVISAAHRLNAMIQVWSGDQSLSQDFSLGDEKYPRLNLVHQSMPVDFRLGTSVSVFLPEHGRNPDQISLFGR